MSATPPKIRSLLFSTLYPSSNRPGHGIFVETRLRHLLASGQVDARVVAPVPWFPSTNPRFGAWSKLASTPARETHNGIEVRHPRYALPPKVGMNIAPLMLALGARSTLRSLQREGFDFDVIDAHYYYPDGVAAALLARWFKKPLFITARGTDLNQISNFAIPRRWIQWAASVASSSIGVSQSLVDKLISLGGDPSRTHVLRNGVDLERFHPVDQAKARNDLGLPMDRRVLLSVGHLVSIKGHDIAIQALADMPEADLAIVGEGPERSSLQELAHSMGVTNRIRFAGARPQTELPLWYSAADALVLCSSREGWANVLLESMACSTPVVATNVGGTAEALSAPEAGVLMQDRSPAGLVAAVGKLFASYPERKMVRQFAEQFDWQATTRGQLALFQAAVAAQQSGLRQYA